MNVATTQQSFQLGADVQLGNELARGGEGSIHEVIWLSGDTQKLAGKYVIKKYFKPSAEKETKLQAMLARPPDDPMRSLKHISIAWPKALILDEQGAFIGFLMPYMDHKKSFPLLRIYNPQDRRSVRVYDEQSNQMVPLREFTWQYLLRIAYNLAKIVEELHGKGYVVGDLNESNILVTATALVTLVDCDSMQVPRPGHTPACFRCPVGKPEYTPPELQGKDFSSMDRAPNHDNFGLAVLIFLILMEGRHPFAAVWRGNGSRPTLAQSIKWSEHKTTFPYVKSKVFSPPKSALPLNILPKDVQAYMKSCFDPRSKKGSNQQRRRPTAQEWAKVLEEAEQHLNLTSYPCQKSALHVYNEHLKKQCPWCARVQRGLPDPFPLLAPLSQPAPASVLSGTTVQPLAPKQTQPLLPHTQPLQHRPSQLSKQQPVSIGKKLVVALFKLLQLAGFTLVTALLYGVEYIIIRFVPVYDPALAHNVHNILSNPIYALIAFIVYVDAPIAFFLWISERSFTHKRKR